MTVSHIPMDKNKLLEELEELHIKLAMINYAERDGKRLMQENEKLKKDPFYQPADVAKRKFKKIITRHYYMQKAKKILHIFYGTLSKAAVTFPLLVLLLSVSVFTVQVVRTKC
jgi:hypothetical protein